MADYRVRLKLTSPLATPLQSGTLFGQLCWIVRYQDGEQALTRWLKEHVEQPLLLSDAFPAGFLPRPLLAPAERPEQGKNEDRVRFIDKLQALKGLRKRRWIAVADYLALREAMNESRLLQRLQQVSAPSGETRNVRQAHNTINRHTGTTPESGGLYFMAETWHDAVAAELDVYVRGDMDIATLQRWFDALGESGFGRDANLGRGQFKARVEIADSRLFDYYGNRLVSLSHGVISANMAACRYKLHTHYGKLGGLFAGGARSPFKYPLSLTRPGMTFSPKDDGPYGEWLAGVHPHHPEIGQHAFHLCLGYTEII